MNTKLLFTKKSKARRLLNTKLPLKNKGKARRTLRMAEPGRYKTWVQCQNVIRDGQQRQGLAR